MTRNEKLDKILLLLIAIDTKELKNENINRTITMEFISETLPEMELVDWEKDSLKDELISTKLVTESENELRITQKGKKFITRGRGFKYLEKVESQEDTIREKTIESFKYGKWGFFMSIIAIVISIIALLLIKS